MATPKKSTKKKVTKKKVTKKTVSKTKSSVAVAKKPPVRKIPTAVELFDRKKSLAAETSSSKTSLDPIEVLVSFDTTGSMYPALTQVRRSVEDLVQRLFREIPNIRMGVLAHGDYCDAGSSYVTRMLDLSADKAEIIRFVQRVEPTGGGDSPECYELALNEGRGASWTHGKKKVFVLIGDDVPHGPDYAMNTKKLNWRNELGLMLEAGIQVYGVQALGRGHASKFYEEVAEKTGGFHLELDQFSDIGDMILAICYKQAGDERLQQFEEELGRSGRMNRSKDRAIGRLLGRKVSTRFKTDRSLHSVSPGRFQFLDVDAEGEDKIPIKKFVESNGLNFNTGRGFYQWSKSETIQANKEIVLMDRDSGDLFTGDHARTLAGIPIGEEVRKPPASLDKYMIFVQSNSNNRALVDKTLFLYEVEDYAR